MIDTVKRKTFRRIHPAVVAAIRKGFLNAIPGWKFKVTKVTPTHACPDGVKLEGYHEETSLYVYGTTDTVLSWTVSLPGVLHGFNGVQLKSDAEIQQAFMDVESILNQISSPSLLSEPFRRLDIAMNLSHPEPDRLLLALRIAGHPWIRSATERYAHGCIRFPGSETVFQAYWKRRPWRDGYKHRGWNTPGVLRIEIQLKTGDKIAEFLDVHEPAVVDLPIRTVLYQRFRDFMLKFPSSEQVSSPCTMAALLALCESQDVRLPGGMTVMDWHRRDVSPSGYSKMRKQVAEHTTQFLSIDWAEILPADRIPETVDVHLDGTTTLVPATLIPPPVKPAPIRLGIQQASTIGLN